MEADDHACQARTSVDCARTGSLTTYARHPSRQHTTAVAVRPRVDGTVEVVVGRDSVPARQLVSRPVATLHVAPAACQPVLLHGAARRLPGVRQGGALAFHLEVAAVRVGASRLLVDEQTYALAAPDPLRHDAPGVLAHLNSAHGEALAACLRARGSTVGFVHATGLDSAGLTVVVASGAGIDTARLRFPAPVSSLSQLPISLSAVLSPGCGCSGSRTAPGAAEDNVPAHEE